MCKFQGSVKKEVEFPGVFTENWCGGISRAWVLVFEFKISTKGCHTNFQGWKLVFWGKSDKSKTSWVFFKKVYTSSTPRSCLQFFCNSLILIKEDKRRQGMPRMSPTRLPRSVLHRGDTHIQVAMLDVNMAF